MGLAVQEFLTPSRWRVNASWYMVYSKSKFHPSIMDGFDFANTAKIYGDAASTITLEIILVYLSITVIMQCLVSRLLYVLAKTYQLERQLICMLHHWQATLLPIARLRDRSHSTAVLRFLLSFNSIYDPHMPGFSIVYTWIIDK